MQQYHTIKAQCKDAVLFFRMGDFYEMFYEDAEIGSKALGITLTSRAHGKSAHVPLAGFPHHALDTYLSKMLKAGYRVAICEQVEDPKLAKGVVKREVIERISPGSAMSEKLLEGKVNNYMGCLVLDEGQAGMAIIDISTGDFSSAEGRTQEVIERLVMLHPVELVIRDDQEQIVKKLFSHYAQPFYTSLPPFIFSSDYAREILIDQFETSSLKGFGIEDISLGYSAAGGIVHYLKRIQGQNLAHIREIRRIHTGSFMLLDEATQRNLELYRSMSEGQRDTTLLAILDRTFTPMGARLFRRWLLHPLLSKDEIEERLDGVEELVGNEKIRGVLRDHLKRCGDLERIIARISTGRANARDVIALKNTLSEIPEILNSLVTCQSPIMTKIREKLDSLDTITQEIERALQPDPPLAVTEGGLIKKGYNSELDELRGLATSGKAWIAGLQTKERERTTISSLKVSYNKVFGYYIEITKPNLSKVPENYIRKQTLVNAERFITPELKEYEEKVLHAEERMATMEYELFQALRVKIAEYTMQIQTNARILATVDCLLSFSSIAVEYQYSRPVITQDTKIVITDGRHPVVERLLQPGEHFISNDTIVDTESEQILIITGPNMAGKSTYLRQVGLIVLLAQVGSFVPAAHAEIGLVDRIFTRVGAFDNVARGESTFLIEMQELANILHNATPHSLILLDEIGRGTSTFDGLSIAWSAAEYLHQNKLVAAKTLFATHYHELTEMETIFPRIKNYNIAVKEWGDSIIFLRKIEPGGCDHSYGIQVARMAGVPREVINRAKEILSNLEASELTPDRYPRLALSQSQQSAPAAGYQISLFAPDYQKIVDTLQSINPDNITPKEAHSILCALKEDIQRTS